MKNKVEVTKEFKFDCAHMLDNHEGLCKNLHGHTYVLQVTATNIDGELVFGGPADSMVIDFSLLKNVVNRLIVDRLDHALVLNRASMDHFEQALTVLAVEYGKKIYPMQFRPTAENMVLHFYDLLEFCPEFKAAGIRITRLRLYETPTSYAEYIVADREDTKC